MGIAALKIWVGVLGWTSDPKVSRVPLTAQYIPRRPRFYTGLGGLNGKAYT
jgi:hypothetical protein